MPHLLIFAHLTTDNKYMQRCLQLAQKGKGHTTPNPMVGAVLVADGRIIGEGWHHIYGTAHAEVDCLNNVARADRQLIPGSTMYVSLEPCAHTGKTPPCADRLVAEKVGKVVIANKDPFELVSGRGIQILQNAGIEVITGVAEQEGLWVNRRFFCFHTQHRPYIILKWAQTTDGYIAPADKSRHQITGSHTSQLVHKWRTEETAILVGSTTAINDNPQLTARLWQGNQPLRIVVSRSGILPAQHHVFDNAAATWIINESRTETIANVRYIQLPWGNNLLTDLMNVLYQNKILSLIVEGGAQMLNSFIVQNLWDEARILTGHTSLGNGIKAPSLTNGTTAFTTSIAADILQVFTNENSPYTYPQGMEL